MVDTLPIDALLDDIAATLSLRGRAVVQAPPGAGKTTRVPLHLLDTVPGRILMLEPRRLAARHAAERMASLTESPIGGLIGYRMRGESKVSDATRIEVVTEGVLTRMLQNDPELPGVGLVIFDEFHERALTADLGLALCLEVTATLREDLRLLVMSATLDAAPVADLIGAPILTSEGRSFPVDLRYLDTPLKPGRWEPHLHDLVCRAVDETDAGVLVFLPGAGEIRRAQTVLADRLPGTCRVLPLYGALPFSEQRRATAPLAEGRKVVLATSIAETSLTLPDIGVVVDAGRARRQLFDPAAGMSRLVTQRVSRAEATQRAGRAGRTGPGVAYRLWTRGEDGALPAFAPPEIETADLAPLALDLAAWGTPADEMGFLTAPNPGRLAEATALLHFLDALDATGRITAHGRALAGLPVHPRLAHMLTLAGPQAAPLAALLEARDPMQDAGSDLPRRVAALRARGGPPALKEIRREADRLGRRTPASGSADLEIAEMAALAYPDRVALRRPGTEARYLLSGGKGAWLPDDDPFAGERLLVATELDGDPRAARIRQAAPITESALRDLFANQIAWHDMCAWSRRRARVWARRQECFGALVLADQVWKDAPPDIFAAAFLDGVRDLGLTWSDAARRFRARVAAARQDHPDLPDLSDAALMASLDDWLLPHVTGLRTKEDWRSFDLAPALRAMLDWPRMQTLDRVAPNSFETPMGRTIPIDYDQDPPEISVRLQEMFGTTRHPVVAGRPLRITLLSPAGRPVQTTADLPGFWAASYADVRKDMRGRYPRHPWPEDPTEAAPTLRAKPRGS